MKTSKISKEVYKYPYGTGFFSEIEARQNRQECVRIIIYYNYST